MEPLCNGEKIEDFFTISSEELGDGSFGTTHLCSKTASGTQFACKSISKYKDKDLDNELFQSVKREVDVMYRVKGHPNIVTIEGAYEDANNFYLVMELCNGGGLHDHIFQYGFYPEARAKPLMKAIMGAIEACHKLGVVHLDLKLESIMFQTSKEDAVVKCIDFGASQFFESGQVFRKCIGTPAYMAPEVWKHCYSQKADIWSCGVIMYNILSGRVPFLDEGEGKIPPKIKNEVPPNFKYRPWPNVSEDAKNLIKKMLSYDPKERPTASQVLKHRWML